MAYIYKITNDINNKIYIGQTTYSLNERLSQHISDSKKEHRRHRPLYKAINKYGIEHFNIELIEETDNSLERERYWIEYFGSFKNGYNDTLGGDGRAYLDYDLIYSTYQITKNITKTSELCHADKASIRKILSTYGISYEERKRNGIISSYKPIAKLDKKTGEVLEVFSSIREAERKYPQTNKHISAVCKGQRKVCADYGWKYI